MFARALADNGSGHLYSIDASEPFLQRTQSYIPQNLKRYVSLSYSEIEIGEMCGEWVMSHRSVPDVSADLVYLDGPDYHDFSVDIETQSDGVLLEPKATEHYTILIDGRWKTFEFTRKNLKGEYAETINPTHFWECLSRQPARINSISRNRGGKKRERRLQIVREFKTQLSIYRAAIRHPRTPRLARCILLAALACAVSPIDLIPDFIPLLIVVPALIALAVRLISENVLTECKNLQLQPAASAPRRGSRR
jgi:uncharacterized membrane protein YkvA (DUF1232 family)